MYFAYEVFEHLLGDGEVSNHAVFHWANRHNIGGSTSQHAFSFRTYSEQCFFACRATLKANSDYGWLVKNDAAATRVNQGICCAKVNGEVVGEITVNHTEHCFVS